jgi:hypothetical protein
MRCFDHVNPVTCGLAVGDQVGKRVFKKVSKRVRRRGCLDSRTYSEPLPPKQ